MAAGQKNYEIPRPGISSIAETLGETQHHLRARIGGEDNARPMEKRAGSPIQGRFAVRVIYDAGDEVEILHRDTGAWHKATIQERIGPDTYDVLMKHGTVKVRYSSEKIRPMRDAASEDYSPKIVMQAFGKRVEDCSNAELVALVKFLVRDVERCAEEVRAVEEKPKCEPPAWANEQTYHWLQNGNSFEVWFWEDEGREWLMHGRAKPFDSHFVHWAGYKWHSVAKPATVWSEKEINDLWKAIASDGGWKYRVSAREFATFLLSGDKSMIGAYE